MKFSKRKELLVWLYENYPDGAFRTSTIAKWGAEHYCNTALRIARKLREEGLLERVEKANRKWYGIFGKEEAYILTDKGEQEAKSLVKQRDFPLLK